MQHMTVLAQDSYLLAVDKPAGIIVHADGTGARTLTDFVCEQLLRDGREAAAHDLQAVNRLDRDTTGIVLFSLDKRTQAAFDALVAGHGTRKRYLAIACGHPAWERTVVDAPLARDRHDARRMRVAPIGSGQPAVTEATRLATRAATQTAPALSLLDIELKTGRKHQIRVHMAHIGLPLLGDGLYGRPYRQGIRGKLYPLMLHAYGMSFVHPVTGESLEIRAPYPKRMRKLFAEPQIDL